MHRLSLSEILIMCTYSYDACVCQMCSGGVSLCRHPLIFHTIIIVTIIIITLAIILNNDSLQFYFCKWNKPPRIAGKHSLLVKSMLLRIFSLNCFEQHSMELTRYVLFYSFSVEIVVS